MKPIRGKPKDLEVAIPLLDEDKVYEIKEVKNQRSLLQNNYLYLVFQAIAKEIGDDPEYVKELLKGYFLREDLKGKSGKIIPRIKSTADLNSKQMTEFIEKIKIWALNNLNMVIPEPQDIRFQQFCDEYKLQ